MCMCAFYGIQFLVYFINYLINIKYGDCVMTVVIQKI